jgi:hypothetical protein
VQNFFLEINQECNKNKSGIVVSLLLLSQLRKTLLEYCKFAKSANLLSSVQVLRMIHFSRNASDIKCC